MQPPWLTLCSPCGDLQSHLDNHVLKSSSNKSWAQRLESGGTKIPNSQLLSHLQRIHLIL
eukprot:12276517-Prorocentrum_lima.AAC.1